MAKKAAAGAAGVAGKKRAGTKPATAQPVKDPKASPDPPANPIRHRIGPGTTRNPKTLPAMKI